MAPPSQNPPDNQSFRGTQPPGPPLSAAESARYTLDMLENLRKIAIRQGQTVLAHLLELAQAEARILVRDAPRPQDG